jgi:hypothetical protein
MVFLNFWTGQVVNSILASKFGGPVQRWGRAGLEEGGAGSNNGGWDHACRVGPAWGKIDGIGGAKGRGAS